MDEKTYTDGKVGFCGDCLAERGTMIILIDDKCPRCGFDLSKQPTFTVSYEPLEE